MSMATQDKIYLFALDAPGIYSAIEKWFEVMRTPTAEEIQQKAEQAAIEARWIDRGRPQGEDPDYKAYCETRFQRFYANGTDAREYFNVDIRHRDSDHMHQHRYYWATLNTCVNHKMSEHIERSVVIYAKQCPDFGIEHDNHHVEGDDAYHFLGVEPTWCRNTNGNAMAWFEKNVLYTAEQYVEVLASRARNEENRKQREAAGGSILDQLRMMARQREAANATASLS